MVEPQRVFSPSRSATPTAASFRVFAANQKNLVLSGLSGSTGGDSTLHISMPGDAPSRTTPVGEWSRPDPRRRQSHTTPSARPPGVRPSTNPTAQGYFQSHFIDQVPEGQHPTPHSLPHTSLHYPLVSSYPMGSGFYGQYTVPSQPSLGVARTSPYPYSHGYHSPGGVDSNVGRREMQSNFQPMAPPPHPQYSYPQHSQDDSSSSGQVLLTASSSRFASHPPPAHSPTSQPYIGSGHYPGMAYPSPMANPQYTYPSHFPATPPMYRPYGPIAYPQHAASAPEEAQGAWYFLSHGTHAPPQPYHYEGGQYQHPYTTRYPHHPDQATLRASATNFRTGAVHSSTASTPLTAPQSGPLTPAPPLAPPYAADTSPRPPTSRPLSASGKPVSRREWHPKPPPHRSPWVMWVGNVPADATQEELWEFFSCDPGGGDSSEEAATFGAVVSIFLIARSNCAFINYSDESSLEAAIKTFHGKRLRPNDPQCPMLVCKVRRSTDDLKSGVGGQRGTGMHKQWVKEQRKLQQSQPGILADASQSDDASISSQSVLDLVDRVGSVSFDPNQPQERRTTKQSSSSESYTSTSSSLLGEHFPTRYFILKSLSERDLEISVQGGLWATQKHNELILDRAYRTSRDVFLIFSVNKSGEFYGYARMAGPIRQGEGRVSWSSRSQTSPPLLSPSAHLTSPTDRRPLLEGPVFQSPESFEVPRPAIASGCPPTLAQAQQRDARRDLARQQRLDHHAESAPAKLGGTGDRPGRSPSLKFSLDQHQRRQQTMAAQAGFHLDPAAPYRAMKDPAAGVERLVDEERVPPLGTQTPGSVDATEAVDKPSPSWGDCFKVEWLELRKVPFHKTRHLRNAWNKGREIKVSRDGTELESSVGKRLLEEWANLVEP